MTLAGLRLYDEAKIAFAEALRLNADDPIVLANTGSLRLDLNDPDGAVSLLREAAAIHPHDPGVLCALCAAMNYSASVTRQEAFDAHVRYGRVLMSGIIENPPPWSGERDPKRRLRVGYLSPDMHDHSVAAFLEPLLSDRDPAAIQTVCLSAGAKTDAVSTRLRSRSDEWIDVSSFPEQDLAQRLGRLRLDLLVDLAGLTAGSRLSALRRRLAPMQITAIGYPNTTGLPTVDYRLVDSITDPPGAEAFAVEALARVPGCFLCYAPPPDAPDPSPSQAAGRECVTFGSFNAVKKITPATAALWSEVLRQVSGSRLVLKGMGLESAEARARIGAMFQAHGVSQDRLDLLGIVPDKRAHLAAYARIDVALDTVPYNGTTTTCEALWMGVPVIALAGDRHAGRVGTSLLTAAGLPELIAHDAASFTRIATGLAADRARLGALRRELRDRVRTSSLCDAPGYARRVEAVYRDLWRRWCAATPS